MGLKAMMELDRLNPVKGRATDAMCMFLAVNTSNVTLLPLGVMAVRASAGSAQPAAIIVPTLLATLCSTVVAVIAARFLAKTSKDPDPVQTDLETGMPDAVPAATAAPVDPNPEANSPGEETTDHSGPGAAGTMGLLGISGSLSGGSSASVRASGFHVGSGEGKCSPSGCYL